MDSAESQKRRRQIDPSRILSPGRVTNGPVDQSLLSDDDDVSAQEMVDLGPVYRCCHIFSVLVRRKSYNVFLLTC